MTKQLVGTKKTNNNDNFADWGVILTLSWQRYL